MSNNFMSPELREKLERSSQIGNQFIHPRDLPEVFGNANPAAGEAPTHISTEQFVKIALTDFVGADKNKNGYLDLQELNDESSNGNQIHKSVFNVLKKSDHVLKTLSNDEWGSETRISKEDLQEFSNIQKLNRSDKNYRLINDCLLDQDVLNAQQRKQAQLGSGTEMIENLVESGLLGSKGSQESKELANQMAATLIHDDMNEFKNMFVRSHKDDRFSESMQLLSRVLRMNGSDLSVARTEDNSLALYRRRSSSSLHLDPCLEIRMDGSAIVRPAYSESRLSVLQGGEVLDQSPVETFTLYSKSLARDIRQHLQVQNDIVAQWLHHRSEARQPSKY